MKFIPENIDSDLEDLIPSFVENTVKDYDLLKSFVTSMDIPEMRKVCHRILGTAESYGFMQLDKTTKDLHQALIDEDKDKVLGYFSELTEYIEYVKKTISIVLKISYFYIHYNSPEGREFGSHLFKVLEAF